MSSIVIYTGCGNNKRNFSESAFIFTINSVMNLNPDIRPMQNILEVVMRKILASAVLFCSVIFVTLFVSCAQDMNYGSIALRMPSSSSRESTNNDTIAQTGQQQGSSSSTTYNYVIDIDGPTKTSETASSGETIFINSLLAGDYTVTCTSYDSKNNFVARGSEKARVEPNQTASVKIMLQKVWLEPTIKVQPQDTNATQNGAVLTCAAQVNQTGELIFQWYNCDEEGNLSPENNPITPNADTQNTSTNGLTIKASSVTLSEIKETTYVICKVIHGQNANDTNNNAVTWSRVCKISPSQQATEPQEPDPDTQPEPDTNKVYSDWSSLSSAISNVQTEATITVSGNMTAESTITIQNKKITIIADSNGCTITRASSHTSNGSYLFKVDTNGELTLGGPASGELILDGGYDTNNKSGTKANAALVGVNATVTGKYVINLLKGCTLQNNYNITSSSPSTNTQHGGAVCFISSTNLSEDSRLFIDGATIQNCRAVHGGGIYFVSGTTCKGTSTNNTTQGHFDAAKSYTGAILSMKSGKISNNSTVKEGSLNGGNGGGIYLYQGKMVMEGGEVSSNTAYWANTMTTGGGGGIFIRSDAVVFLIDGEISSNTAENSYGGGIYGIAGKVFIYEKSDSGGISVCGNTDSNSSSDNIYPSYSTYNESGILNADQTAPIGSNIYGSVLIP